MATRTPRPEPDADTWAATPAGSVGIQTMVDDPEANQSPIERVMVALSETADPDARARLMLYRVFPGGLGRPERVEYCDDMDPAEFEAQGLSGIREVWGAGTFEARLMGHKKGSPRFVRLAAPRFTLAPLPANGATGGPMPRQSDANTAGIEAALRALADSQARMFEAMTAQRSNPPVDPVQQMQQTLGLMTAMREAMGPTQQTQAAQPQKSTISEIVDAIKELKEVSNLVNPGGAPEKSMVEQLLEVATPIVSMVQQTMQQRQSPQSAQSFTAPQENVPTLRIPKQFSGDSNVDVSSVERNTDEHSVLGGQVGVEVEAKEASENKVSPLAPSSNQEAESAAQEIILNELQTYLSQLVAMAERKASVQEGAELVYDKLPDDWIELMHMPIWWDALKTAAPHLEKHAAWIHAVRDEVVKMFAEDESEVEKLDGTASNA